MEHVQNQPFEVGKDHLRVLQLLAFQPLGDAFQQIIRGFHPNVRGHKDLFKVGDHILVQLFFATEQPVESPDKPGSGLLQTLSQGKKLPFGPRHLFLFTTVFLGPSPRGSIHNSPISTFRVRCLGWDRRRFSCLCFSLEEPLEKTLLCGLIVAHLPARPSIRNTGPSETVSKLRMRLKSSHDCCWHEFYCPHPNPLPGGEGAI